MICVVFVMRRTGACSISHNWPGVAAVFPAGRAEQDCPAVLCPVPAILRQREPGLPGSGPRLRTQLQVTSSARLLPAHHEHCEEE